MKTFRNILIPGSLALLMSVGTAMAQDGAYMTPSKAEQIRKEQAQAQKEREAKLAERRAQQQAEYDRILKEQDEVSDWYNRRDMTVTVEEMQRNLERMDGKDSLSANQGGKYSRLLREFNGETVVLDNVDKVYVLNDMDYDPWTRSYYGYDNRSGVNITINTNPYGYYGYGRPYYGGYYGRPYYGGYYGGWYDPWYYDAWTWRSPYFYRNWYPGSYYYGGWYDPWYDPFYYGIGFGAFSYGWGWGYPYRGYGYYGSYWNGYYDGAYYANRNIRYNSNGRRSGRYVNGGVARTYNNTVTRTRADYGRQLGVTPNAVRTRAASANTVYRNYSPNYNSRNNSVNNRWNNNTVTRTYSPSRSTYSTPSRSTYSSPSRSSGSTSRSSGGNSRSRR